MSDSKDNLIQMFSEDPKLLDIINSKEHMAVLTILEQDSTDFLNLKRDVLKYIYIKKDIILYNILESLIQKDLIKEIGVNENKVYYITEKGKKFMSLYKETKKEFDI
jgi:predicted transcriptional regulator